MVTGHFNLGEWPRSLQLHGLPASPGNAENRVEAFEFLGSGRSRPCGMMVPRRSNMADHSLYNVPGRTTLIPLEAAVDFTLGRRAEVGRVRSIVRRAEVGQEPSLTVCSWPRSRNARCASTCIALWPVGAAKRKRLFTRAARKETVLPVRSAIMPIPSEVAPYDFRP
jgi:hypothetical protein